MMNSADRILQLVKTAKQVQPDQKRGVDVWANVFGFPPVYEERHVLEKLLLVQKEIDTIELAIKKGDKWSADQARNIGLIRAVFSVFPLLKQGEELLSQISLSVTGILTAFSFGLNNDEKTISSGELSKFQALLDEIRQLINEWEGDSILKEYVSSVLDEMQKALENYPIQGAAAFARATEEALLDYHRRFENDDEVAEAYDELSEKDQKHAKNAIEKIKEVLKKAGTWATRAENLNRLITTIADVTKLLVAASAS